MNTFLKVIRKGNKQFLVKTEVRRFGWPKITVLDEETIPDHVMIDLGCFGDVGNWKSKFSDVIGNNHQTKKLVEKYA